MNLPLFVLVALLLAPGSDKPKNPWIKKAPEIIGQFEREPSAKNLEAAFDAAWRADDWASGLKLATTAQEKFAGNANLYGRTLRALWRAGKLHEAEQEAKRIPVDTNDTIALAALITLHDARGDEDQAQKLAERLGRQKDLSTNELITLASSRNLKGKGAEVARILRQAKALSNPDNGYPDIFMDDLLEGNADFYAAVGDEPLNQITKTGSADMPVLQLINLPCCTVMIDGKGPYRLIVDTGGSVTLSLNSSVIEELGLKSMGTSSVRGVSGSQDSSQHIVDELRVGSIVCKRVVTRGIEFAAPLNTIADGILGTGVFGDGRMLLDFDNAKLSVSKSSDENGRGTPIDVRLLADAKIVGGITLQGQSAWSIFDTGADVVAISPLRLKALFPEKDFLEVRGAAGMGVGQGDNSPISMSDGLDFEIAGRKFVKHAAVGLGVLDTSFSPILGVQCDFLAGMSLFRGMHSMTIDFAKVKMWIDWLPVKE